MRLDLLKRSLICSSAFKIWRELLYFHHEGWLCCWKRLYDNMEQLPAYLNAHWAISEIFWMRIEQHLTPPWCHKSNKKVAPNWESGNKIRLRIEHPLSIFKIKMIIWMSLELKHMNFKDQHKIKEGVNTNSNIRRHMSILVAFEWHYFQALLNWWHSPFKTTGRIAFLLPVTKRHTRLFLNLVKSFIRTVDYLPNQTCDDCIVHVGRYCQQQKNSSRIVSVDRGMIQNTNVCVSFFILLPYTPTATVVRPLAR